MNLRKTQLEVTRKAILDALAGAIVEDGALGFSVQDVADRAGVTHRTVYNHFPTRDALNDALAEHVEDELSKILNEPKMVDFALMDEIFAIFRQFEQLDAHVRAYVMLMIASRGPAKVSRDRTAEFQKAIERESKPMPADSARMATSAVRMFGSSVGWHLLTEHLDLTTEEAIAASTWATKTLLEALADGNFPKGQPK